MPIAMNIPKESADKERPNSRFNFSSLVNKGITQEAIINTQPTINETENDSEFILYLFLIKLLL